MVQQRDDESDKSDRPEFGILGFGRFGRLAAEHLATRGRVLWWDPHVAGAAPLEEACHARAVVLAVPIGAMREVLGAIRGRLLPGTLVVDTCSVKVWPCRWMLEALPPEVEVLGTHPLFGPDSAASGLRDQPIAFVPLRMREPARARVFLESFGLRVIATSADDPDREMAETQSIVHWLGRALERTGAHPRDLQTTGYARLLGILDQVTRDSWELFLDLERWNPYAAEERARWLRVLSDLDREVPLDPPFPPAPRS